MLLRISSREWIHLAVLIICVSSGANTQTLSCATLRSNRFPNDSLVLKGSSVLGNIKEEYLAADKSWNVSSTWTVNSSCELTSCSQVYLNGNCSTFSGGATSPSQVWLSARCKCNTGCVCPNDFNKKSVCARTYLKSGGCEFCDASYVEMREGSHDIFPDTWNGKISSLLVKSGCILTVYDENELDGNSEMIDGPQLKNWDTDIGSYQCECNEISGNKVPRATNSGQSSPAEITIPGTLDAVVGKLAENNFNHPGLLAALSSLTHERSSKNAYILLIGSSGAGKSSAVNILLNSNVSTAGERISTTSEILEFRIPIPVPELGIGNSELRIIDTPGLGDTRGIQNDAQFLATLDDYLKNHEELKSVIPNLVLIFHSFDDNRLHGEGAKFVRMIRGLEGIRGRITDEIYSNVLFVFSHLCSVSNMEKNPIPRLLKFREAVELYSFFPKPIMTTVIENKGWENDLIMRNGNFELPNKELYPQNLLDRFDTITNRCEDTMGNAIVNTDAVRNQNDKEEFNISVSTYPLVNSNHNLVPKYLSLLTSAAYNVNNSEVSDLLAAAYEGMNNTVKAEFPNALPDLQRYLNLKNIKSKTDVPLTTTAILELLFGIEQNQATLYLQETAISLKPPMFPISTVAGFSYDIFKNSILSVSPFKLDNRRPSTSGFMLPNVIRCTKEISPPIKGPLNVFEVFDTKQLYFNHISLSLLGDKLSPVANSTEIFSVLTSKPDEGYFIKDNMPCSSASNMNCFTATRLYKTFQFDLETPNSAIQLQPDFIRRVQNLTPFNESNADSVEEWTTFFNDFGTHVVKSAEVGGRIDMLFTLSNQVPVSSAVQKVLKSFDFADNPLGAVSKYKEDSKTVFADSGSVQHTLTFRGGNQAYHTTDISKMSLEKASKIMKDWKKSLKFYPAVFSKEVLPIGEIVSNYFPASQQSEVRNKIHDALARLVSSTLKYVAPTPDPKILEELKRVQMENEEKLRQLDLERQRKEEEARKQRLADIEAQRKLEQEAWERAEQRRKDEEAAAAKRRREEEERQRQLRAEEERRRREQEEAERRHREYMRQQAEEEARQRNHLEWLRREAERRWREAQERRPSCLKKGTKILLADFTEKSVELLSIGDFVLDKDLKPTRILGISYEFLLNQKFHGFDNKTFFFTDTHIFAGIGNDNGSELESELQFYTTSTATLFAQNPLLQYLNIQEFGNSFNESTHLLYYKHGTTSEKPIQKDVTVFREMKPYSMDTLIYFIQVDSPSGTYFAEGYLCRHEVPPLEYWPNTMPVLMSLFGTRGFETAEKIPYSIDTIYFIGNISSNVQNAVLNVLERELLLGIIESENKIEQTQQTDVCITKTLNDFDLEKLISKVFGNPTLAYLSMEIYGGSGSIIANYLDNPNVNATKCHVQKLQFVLFETINNEINKFI